MGRSRYQTLSGRRWQLLRLKIFARDGWRCRACHRAGKLECDHIRPLHKGGAPYDPGNLQSLCRRCHIAKTGGRERAARPGSRRMAGTRQGILPIDYKSLIFWTFCIGLSNLAGPLFEGLHDDERAKTCSAAV